MRAEKSNYKSSTFYKPINSLKSQSPAEWKEGRRHRFSPHAGYCMRLLYSHQRCPVQVLCLDGHPMYSIPSAAMWKILPWPFYSHFKVKKGEVSEDILIIVIPTCWDLCCCRFGVFFLISLSESAFVIENRVVPLGQLISLHPRCLRHWLSEVLKHLSECKHMNHCTESVKDSQAQKKPLLLEGCCAELSINRNTSQKLQQGTSTHFFTIYGYLKSSVKQTLITYFKLLGEFYRIILF